MTMNFVAIAIVVVALFDQAIGQTCGGTFYGSGSFSSPNYPQLYPNSRVCVWNLTAITGYYVKLSFSAINVQAFSDDLVVFSGGIAVAEYGGNLAATSAVFGSSVSVIFVSDSAGQDTGFSVQFTSAAPACGIACSLGQCTVWTPGFPWRYPPQTSCSWSVNTAAGRYLAWDVVYYNAAAYYDYMQLMNLTNGITQNTVTYYSNIPPVSQLLSNGARLSFVSRYTYQGYGILAQFSSKGTKCGSVLSGAGSLTTPGYPGNYPNDVVCIWRLDATYGKRVQLQFSEFNTELNYDTLRVFNDGVLVAKLSGALNLGTYTMGSSVTIEFLSDFTVTARGVSLSFSSV